MLKYIYWFYDNQVLIERAIYLKVIAREFERDLQNVELYIVDKLSKNEVFIELIPNFSEDKINDVIHTNGRVTNISAIERINDLYEVRYSLVNADYVIKKPSKDALQIFVTEGFNGKVKVKNRKINRTIKKYYTDLQKRIFNKQEFAKQMTIEAQDINLPFGIVLAFKADRVALKKLVSAVESSIDRSFYTDTMTMQNLLSESPLVRIQTLDYMGLEVPEEYQKNSIKIAKYVHDCLKRRRILRYNEN